MKPKIIQQGAEAKIILSNNFIIKDRIKKSYRIPELDNKIRKLRTRSEAKLLIKASKVIPVPELNETDEITKKLVMKFIDGEKLSDRLDKFPLKKQKEICKSIGENTAKLHDVDIIHGDLTTSNMILKNDKIYFIDFGLGFNSHKFEDKAVDIHLLRQALESKHFKHWEALFKEVLKAYSKSKDSKIVLERLKAVEKRGRYKDKY
ncbi:MAG TPA: Kae1-associated serine/threonine protein kinase [Candidatus Pacearchaeota archaeon]|nr:Kae1-associated serine/threonine protein kinase [Candidatus Pacearchaeota archaeon]